MPLLRSLLRFLLREFAKSFHLLPHLSERFHDAISIMRMCIGMFGVAFLVSALLFRAIGIKLAALRSVMCVLYARRMLSAKLTQLGTWLLSVG